MLACICLATTRSSVGDARGPAVSVCRRNDSAACRPGAAGVACRASGRARWALPHRPAPAALGSRAPGRSDGKPEHRSAEQTASQPAVNEPRHGCPAPEHAPAAQTAQETQAAPANRPLEPNAPPGERAAPARANGSQRTAPTQNEPQRTAPQRKAPERDVRRRSVEWRSGWRLGGPEQPFRTAIASWSNSTARTACAGPRRCSSRSSLVPESLDLEILALVACMRHVLSSQIHRRFNPGRAATTTQRRLKRLSDAGLVRRFQFHRRDGGGVPMCYAITATALELLHAHDRLTALERG